MANEFEDFIQRGQRLQKAVEDVMGKLSTKEDRVDIAGGIVHLPAEFNQVARLANQAGLEGFEIIDVEYGVDIDALAGVHRIHASPCTEACAQLAQEWPDDIPVRVVLRYRRKEPA